MLTNKEDFRGDQEIYKMLTDLEESIRKGNDFTVSIMLAKLKSKGFTFEVSFEGTDQQVQ